MIDLGLLLATIVLVALVLFCGTALLVLAVPLVLVGAIAVWIVEYRGFGNVRKRWGKLEFPLITLKHETTGRRVRLLGVIHFADASYWSTLQGVIDREGESVVLYERVLKPTQEEMDALTEKERAWYENVHLGHKTLRGQLQALLGLSFQGDGLTYPAHWINTDMSGGAFVKAMVGLEERFPGNPFMAILDHEPEQAPFVRWMIQKIFSHISLSELRNFGAKSAYRRERDAIILDYRNFLGVNGILAHGKERDVVSIWGAAHLPGMLHLLKQLGFEEETREWFGAWKPPAYSLLHAIRDMRRLRTEDSKAA